MTEKSSDAVRDARVLGYGKMSLLGLQHMFAMFGATILVPILVNSYFHGHGISVQTTLFCAGLGTLGFHLISKFKVPAFLGSSFAFLGGFATIAELDTGKFANMSYAEKLPYACGGVVVAGLLYLVLAALVYLVGVEKVMRFLPPVVTGPLIMCIGLSLLPSAASNFMTNWPLALVATITLVIFSVYGKGMFKIIPVLMGVVVAYIVAIAMQSAGMTNADGSAILNTAAIASEAWIGLPPIQMVKFDPVAIGVMAPIALATMMEHVGDIVAIGATTGEDFITDPGLHRTLIGDGIMTALAGLIGGPPNTTYGENTSTLELSKVYDPRVIRIAAVYAIVISFLPKLSGLIGTMPTAIIGGISIIMYVMITGIGIRNIVENKVNLKKPRNLMVIALILGCGLGFRDGIQIGSVTITAMALAAIVGILANAIFPGRDYQFGKDKQADEHNGLAIGKEES